MHLELLVLVLDRLTCNTFTCIGTTHVYIQIMCSLVYGLCFYEYRLVIACLLSHRVGKDLQVQMGVLDLRVHRDRLVLRDQREDQDLLVMMVRRDKRESLDKL